MVRRDPMPHHRSTSQPFHSLCWSQVLLALAASLWARPARAGFGGRHEDLELATRLPLRPGADEGLVDRTRSCESTHSRTSRPTSRFFFLSDAHRLVELRFLSARPPRDPAHTVVAVGLAPALRAARGSRSPSPQTRLEFLSAVWPHLVFSSASGHRPPSQRFRLRVGARGSEW